MTGRRRETSSPMYAKWNAYRNQYWPAQYTVDQSGTVLYERAREGQYEEIQRAIQKLLNLTGWNGEQTLGSL
jgi:hypothetical protein